METNKNLLLAEKVFFEAMNITSYPKHRVIIDAMVLVQMITEGINRSEKFQIDWVKLSEKFFNECVWNDSMDGLKLRIDFAPHDLFEWFRKNIGCTISNWIKFDSNKEIFDKLVKKEGDCLIKFDNGKILRFNEENWPFGEVTHFKAL